MTPCLVTVLGRASVTATPALALLSRIYDNTESTK